MEYCFPSPKNDRSGWPWTVRSEGYPPTMPDGRPWPRISVVTPSFNQGPFLEETIRSVLLQGYPDLEYIVIDGGSTDESIDIIKKYDPWLTCWVSEKDNGQTHAINKGLKIASGKILTYLNSDDYLEKDALRKVAVFASKVGDFGLIHGKSLILEGELITGERGAPFDALECLSDSRNPLSQPSVFFSASAFDDVGFLDESLHLSMDWDFFVKIGLRHKAYFFNEVLSYFRHYPLTKTSTAVEGFGPEMKKILYGLLVNNEKWKIPFRIKRKAISSVNIRCAHGLFRNGRYDEARNSILISFLYRPLKTVKAVGIKQFIHFLFACRFYLRLLQIKQSIFHG